LGSIEAVGKKSPFVQQPKVSEALSHSDGDINIKRLNSTTIETSAKTEVNFQSAMNGFDKCCKILFFKNLKSLPKGVLCIEEGGQQRILGDPSNGGIHATISVNHKDFYRSFVLGGSVGAGEAYMHGYWNTPNLVNVIQLMASNVDWLNRWDKSAISIPRVSNKIYHWMNRNTVIGSQKNIAAHYDLSNDFFELFLDPTMMYSSAIFPTVTTSLEEASLNKLDTICKGLQLTEKDHLLEVGTGWGGLAIHAAKNYGCRVTTTTISQEQYSYACERVRSEGLEDKVTLLLEDYRSLEGQFDKLVSIEMIEAVGDIYYDTYFLTCSKLLKNNGLMFLQAITIPDQRYKFALQSVDFIQRYIFPGGGLPSHSRISGCIANSTDMQMVKMDEIGLSYAETLHHWRERFHQKLDKVTALGFDDTFVRMWEFYLCYCEGGFRERIISTAQYLIAKPGWRPQ
jgi:cyclopropane-fatty-acyl-phospholipid synthase